MELGCMQGDAWALAGVEAAGERQENRQSLRQLPEAIEHPHSLQNQELISKIAAAQQRLQSRGLMGFSHSGSPSIMPQSGQRPPDPMLGPNEALMPQQGQAGPSSRTQPSQAPEDQQPGDGPSDRETGIGMAVYQPALADGDARLPVERLSYSGINFPPLCVRVCMHVSLVGVEGSMAYGSCFAIRDISS